MSELEQCNSIRTTLHSTGIVEVCFDLEKEAVNKFNEKLLYELRRVILSLRESLPRGILFTTAKESFSVGADVTEFLGFFRRSETELAQWISEVRGLFTEIEDLSIPSVAALSGYTLGGGLEFAMCSSLRVAEPKAVIGLPETKLGLIPGWGGTVRLPRICSAKGDEALHLAIQRILSGEPWDAQQALAAGVVDELATERETVRELGLRVLNEAIEGKRDWKAKREQKLRTRAYSAHQISNQIKTPPNYPAPAQALEVIRSTAQMSRDEAFQVEMRAFIGLAKGRVAQNLIGLFLDEQGLKKRAKATAKKAVSVKQAAVLGAGIMGGGIAYQSAVKGVPVIMKDIQDKALQLGMSEAKKHLTQLTQKGKLSPSQAERVLGDIRPQLDYAQFESVDLIVEAVVENEAIKNRVLDEVEAQASSRTIIASNTSTIPISRLGARLKRPENFCGMHFFNPVHRMPLVEIIRGRQSSPAAVASTVGFALALGKLPVVVNDCPGFLINRLLFPYLAAFFRLIQEGVSFQRIDRIMESYGWPMGPAYLLDVVGIDTAVHAGRVMADAYPDRMKVEGSTAAEMLLEKGRLGQKNLKGFYQYSADQKGPPRKQEDPEVIQWFVDQQKTPLSEDDIRDRLILAMMIEASRCLEEGIAECASDVDISVVYGIGFPTFRGGILRDLDAFGIQQACTRAQAFSNLGALYHPTKQMIAMAKEGKTFYP